MLYSTTFFHYHPSPSQPAQLCRENISLIPYLTVTITLIHPCHSPPPGGCYHLILTRRKQKHRGKRTCPHSRTIKGGGRAAAVSPQVHAPNRNTGWLLAESQANNPACAILLFWAVLSIGINTLLVFLDFSPQRNWRCTTIKWHLCTGHGTYT